MRYGQAVDHDPLLTYDDLAALAGVTPATLRKYKSKGLLPPPDEDVWRRPRWRRSTFQAWMDSRPGPGARTDLHRART